MIVCFDSNNPTGKPTIRGESNGTPRIWSVQLRAEGLDGPVTFNVATDRIASESFAPIA